ncbi:MAG: glycosyltransferase family 4 protein [Patescibacteria group bacterium]
MRIALIGQKGIPAQFGGVEKHVEELSTRLAKTGQTVLVYCRRWYTPTNINVHQGVYLVHAPTIHTKHLDAIVHTVISTLHAMFIARVDVIHYHGVGPALVAWLPRVFTPRSRVVVTFHCIDRQHQKWGRFARLMLRAGEWAAVTFAHRTITVSQTLQAYCEREYHAATCYIPNGVTLPAESVATEALATWQLTSGEYFIAVSRLVRHKAIHNLIEAFRQVPTTKKLVIVGGSAFTDRYVAELHALADDDPRIVFTGYQHGAALQQLFSHAYAFIHPSESEGLPITVLEAMSFSKAVIASNIPEHREVVGQSGILFAVGSPTDLADKIQHALDYPERLEALGERGRMIVAEKYNWDDIVKHTTALYTAIMIGVEPMEMTAKPALRW